MINNTVCIAIIFIIIVTAIIIYYITFCAEIKSYMGNREAKAEDINEDDKATDVDDDMADNTANTAVSPSAIIFITGNKNKLKEAEEILGRQIVSKEIDLPEIQSVEVLDVVKRKILDAYASTHEPTIVEDTGLYIESINVCGELIKMPHSYPGALIKSYLESLGADVMTQMHGGSPAVARTVVGYCDQAGPQFFTGDISGTISAAPRGTNGFGWDNIFIPDGGVKTFAEMTSAEKNSLSMRKMAFALAKDVIG